MELVIQVAVIEIRLRYFIQLDQVQFGAGVKSLRFFLQKLDFTLSLQSELSGEPLRAELQRIVTTSEPAWTNDQIISWIMASP